MMLTGLQRIRGTFPSFHCRIAEGQTIVNLASHGMISTAQCTCSRWLFRQCLLTLIHVLDDGSTYWGSIPPFSKAIHSDSRVQHSYLSCGTILPWDPTCQRRKWCHALVFDGSVRWSFVEGGVCNRVTGIFRWRWRGVLVCKHENSNIFSSFEGILEHLAVLVQRPLHPYFIEVR